MDKLEIKVDHWALKTIKGEKKISGEYVVMYGDKEVADKMFNGEYSGLEVKFPAALMAEIERIDNEINEHIKNTFK